MPVLVGILSLGLLPPPASAAAPVPAAYSSVLNRRGLDAERLKPLGFGCDGARCYRADAAGRLVPPGLTPEELDAALGEKSPAPEPRREERRYQPLALKLDVSPRSLGRLYDGGSSAVADALVPTQPPPAPPEPTPPFAEPPFDASWTRIVSDLRNPKRRARALRALSARFREDETSATGLGPDAPEALRLAALAVHEGFGGPGAAVELRRELATVAEFQPDRKYAFARTLTSPLTVYVALNRSRATHSLDSQLYFQRMEALLAADGRTLTGFLREIDPEGRGAATFLLRSHAYDALLPYLNRHPAEAAAIAPLLFSDGRAAEIAARASALEGLLTQLAASGRRSGALAAFLRGLQDRAAAADAATADRIAIYLKVNEKLLPRAQRADIDALAARLPPGLLEDSGLLPPEPFDSWPGDHWTFVLHFASTGSFNASLARFAARGYRRENDSDGASVVKTFGTREIRLKARLYPGDKDGFMRGAVAKRFLAGVARDLRDPDVQGVILRNHAQFRVANLFGKGMTPGKLILDGSCRSAWDVQTLRRSCPTCSFIVNSGTGQGHVNNEAVIAVIEGLARGEDWDQIGDEWSRLSPASARIQGPWTPPYAEALAALAAREKAVKRAASAP